MSKENILGYIKFIVIKNVSIKNVSSSTSHKKLHLSVFTSFRLYENLREFFLTLSFMNRF